MIGVDPNPPIVRRSPVPPDEASICLASLSITHANSVVDSLIVDAKLADVLTSDWADGAAPNSGSVTFVLSDCETRSEFPSDPGYLAAKNPASSKSVADLLS